MKIKDIISELQSYPEDTEVYISDYRCTQAHLFDILDDGIDCFGIVLCPNSTIPDVDILEADKRLNEQYEDDEND